MCDAWLKGEPPPTRVEESVSKAQPKPVHRAAFEVRDGTSVQGHSPQADLKTMWRGMAQRKNPKQCGGA